MTKSTTIGTTHTTVTLPGDVSSTKPSIRSIIMSGILAGTPKAEIEAQVKLHHEDSAAAKKFPKHLAWYRATMKKAGKLPEQAPSA